MKYSIEWRWNGQPGCYVHKMQSNRHPYTSKLSEAKVWVSRANAERFLSLKDPTWASMCVIVENPGT